MRSVLGFCLVGALLASASGCDGWYLEHGWAWQQGWHDNPQRPERALGDAGAGGASAAAVDQSAEHLHGHADRADSEASLVTNGGSIWGVHTVVHEGRTALHWFELESSTELLVQDGLIADPTRDLFMGSLVVNEQREVVIDFSASNDTTLASGFVLGRTREGETRFGEPVLRSSGERVSPAW